VKNRRRRAGSDFATIHHVVSFISVRGGRLLLAESEMRRRMHKCAHCCAARTSEIFQQQLRNQVSAGRRL
jgi:hypothetical protein